jgi:hypothetical protein
MRPPRENMLLCESITRAAKDAARWGLCHNKLMADRSDEPPKFVSSCAVETAAIRLSPIPPKWRDA